MNHRQAQDNSAHDENSSCGDLYEGPKRLEHRVYGQVRVRKPSNSLCDREAHCFRNCRTAATPVKVSTHGKVHVQF